MASESGNVTGCEGEDPKALAIRSHWRQEVSVGGKRVELEREELRHRLAAGESLEIVTGGGSYEVWAEPYANPPVVFYEGRAIPYGELEDVIGIILTALQQGAVSCRWVEPRGVQVKSCEEAYRLRAAEP
jgi:hypothetical protein